MKLRSDRWVKYWRKLALGFVKMANGDPHCAYQTIHRLAEENLYMRAAIREHLNDQSIYERGADARLYRATLPECRS